jgi:hypothetical protein
MEKLVMAVLLVASTTGGASAALAGVRATDAPEVPPPFAVCVVTSDAEGFARLDSYHHDEVDAQARRRDLLLADTWVTSRPLPGPEQTQPDREYEYPRTAIVKAFVDPTLVNESACMPPSPIAVSDAGADQVRRR